MKSENSTASISQMRLWRKSGGKSYSIQADRKFFEENSKKSADIKKGNTIIHRHKTIAAISAIKS
jgi:hypothetical protein